MSGTISSLEYHNRNYLIVTKIDMSPLQFNRKLKFPASFQSKWNETKPVLPALSLLSLVCCPGFRFRPERIDTSQITAREGGQIS